MDKPFVKEGLYYNVMAETGGRIKTRQFETLQEVDEWMKALKRPARIVVEEAKVRHRLMGVVTIPAPVSKGDIVH